MTDINYMDPNEFRDGGYLHEVNRLVLHPLGLALSVEAALEAGVEIRMQADDFETLKGELEGDLTLDRAKEIIAGLVANAEAIKPHQAVGLGGIWDCRDDAEGIAFGDSLRSAEKARAIAELWLQRCAPRTCQRGYMVQPVDASGAVLTTHTAQAMPR